MNETDRMSDRDDAVSAAYRDLADERTPEQLDRRILETAAAELQRSYLRRTHWTRPLAWAAIFVVTLTIILQLSDIPAPPPDMPQSIGESARRNEAVMPATGGETAAEAQRPETLSDGDDAGLGERRIDMLNQAREIARTRSSEFAAGEPQQAAAAAAPEARVRACDEETRGDPERWIDCIESLRAAGRTAAADAELEELLAAFPNVELP